MHLQRHFIEKIMMMSRLRPLQTSAAPQHFIILLYCNTFLPLSKKLRLLAMWILLGCAGNRLQRS